MRTHDRSRFLAWLLLVAMVLTMLPTAAFAADAATYAKVDLTAAEDITAGQYLIYGTSIQATDQRGHSRLYVYRRIHQFPAHVFRSDHCRWEGQHQ